MNRTAQVITLVAFLLASGCSRAPHAPALNPDSFMAAQQPAPSQVASPEIGRYQLLAAEHIIVPKGASYTDKDLFRIDTVTGKTEVFISGANPQGKRDHFWSPIDEYPDRTDKAK